MASPLGAHNRNVEATPRERIVLRPDERLDAVLDVIRAARKRLILSLFRCNEARVLEELAEALRRGARVEVLLTPRAKRWKQRLQEIWSQLEVMGAKVHRYADPVVKYHAKYIVADDEVALVGSLNFTRKCFRKTCDFIQITRDPQVIAGLQRIFEQDSGAEPLPADLSERLIVGPEKARGQLTGLLEGAARSIEIVDTKVTDPELVDLLRRRKADGIQVDVIARKKVVGLRSHGKLLLIDGRLAVIGSMALSALSLEFRRELALVIDDPRCIEQLNTLYHAIAEEPGPNIVGREPGR